VFPPGVRRIPYAGSAGTARGLGVAGFAAGYVPAVHRVRRWLVELLALLEEPVLLCEVR